LARDTSSVRIVRFSVCSSLSPHFMSPTKYWLHKLLIFRWIYCVHLYPSPPRRRVQLNKWVTELVNYWRKAVLLDRLTD